eukprot:7284012-Alexandrium_andersonii.AAC.1
MSRLTVHLGKWITGKKRAPVFHGKAAECRDILPFVLGELRATKAPVHKLRWLRKAGKQLGPQLRE